MTDEEIDTSNSDTSDQLISPAAYEIPVVISIILGGAMIEVRDLLRIKSGTVVELDQKVDSPIEIHVNNKLVARGKIIVVDEKLGINITEVLNKDGGK